MVGRKGMMDGRKFLRITLRAQGDTTGLRSADVETTGGAVVDADIHEF